MIKINRKDIYHDNYGWLDTYHHFSFGNYYDPQNMNFGDIRVINDDVVKASEGFEMHPHKDMEIITYVIKGELTHGDSLDNKKTIGKGWIQYISAGTGIYHQEHNYGKKDLRFLQIWIVPDKKGYSPTYEEYNYGSENKIGKFLHLVSGKEGKAPLKINQDADIFVGKFDGKTIYRVPKGRKVYGIVIDGRAEINGEYLETRDAFKSEEGEIKIEVIEKSHIVILQTK